MPGRRPRPPGADRNPRAGLSKGDGIFFNPALLHAAGHNRSADIRRMANLLQVSSAIGRCMETVDRVGTTARRFRSRS